MRPANTKTNEQGAIRPHEKEWERSPYPIPADSEPTNTLRVLGWQGLPPVVGPQGFLVTNRNRKSHLITIEKHTLQVLLGLMQSPIYSSSLARIGEYVRVLREDHQVEIHTERYCNNGFGVYFLVSQVEEDTGGAF